MTILVQQQLRKLAERATPGPWELQTSNSWQRIGTAGGRFADGDVLAPTTHRGDNHPDLAARQEDLDFIVAADPATVLALLDELDQLKAENAELRKDKARLDRGYIMTGVPCVNACEHRGIDLRAAIDRVTQLDEQRAQSQAMTKEQP